MSKNRKISNQNLEYIKNIEPYVTKRSKKDYNTLKSTLMESVESALGEKNVTKKTRAGLEYIVFLAVERGFSHPKPVSVKEKTGVAVSTLYPYLTLLQEHGVIRKMNFSSKKQNGYGAGIYFFTAHPYFDHFNEMFGFDVCRDEDTILDADQKANKKADEKAENAEIPCPTRLPSVFETPTYSLPSLDLKELKKDLHTNVFADAEQPTSHNPVIKYVPKEINSVYAGIFNFRLRNIWQKITQAWKTIKQSVLVRADLITIGTQIIKRIFQLWKDRQRENKEMTVDEMCAFAYVSTRETIYNTLATLHMEDYDPEENAIVGQAVRSIPEYESICLQVHPEYDYESMKEHVSECIAWGFPMLSRQKLERVMDYYDDYTTISVSNRMALCL